MERIENILRRIQELYYSKHEKTGIDIDLMLDYTRVMYADLLEWRKRFKEEPAAAEQETLVKTAAEQPRRMAPETPKAAQQAVPVTPQTEAVKPAEVPEIKAEETRAEEKPVATVQAEDRVTGPGKEEAEAELVQEVLHNNSSAINFEPPAPKLPHAEEIADGLVEEDPVINTPVEEIVLPEVEPVQQQPILPKANPGGTGSGPALKKDIRGAIGINDKYLFLNELFANNKTDYEEALDQLRLFDSYEQAYTWLHAHPAKKNGWEEGDDTVQAFLTLVSQYFSSK